MTTHEQIEAVADGLRPDHVLDVCEEAGEDIDVNGVKYHVPAAGDPKRCPDCKGDLALRVGYSWCGAIPGPCQGEGEPSGHAMRGAPARKPIARRRHYGRFYPR